MRPQQLEHLLRAAGESLGRKEFTVIGSQAIIASYPGHIPYEELPMSLTMSVEADMIPDVEEMWEDLEREFGENSLFAEQFGYYADGVEECTATLPMGWKDRLIPFASPNTNGVTGYCLEPHDLVVSKLIAGRAKDKDFCQCVIELDLVCEDLLYERLDRTYDVEPIIIEVAKRHVHDFFEAYRQALELLDIDE